MGELKHAFVSPKADSGNPNEVSSGEWGEGHAIGGQKPDFDLGAVMAQLTRPAIVNAEDDDFDQGAAGLDAKWLKTYFAGGAATLLDPKGWCNLTGGNALIQPVPVGDWSIWTECINTDLGAASFVYTGLILTSGPDVLTATDARWGVGQNNTLQSYRYVAEKFINSVFSSAYSQHAGNPHMDSKFMRIVKSGTTYTFDYSDTGLTWARFFQTSALGFVPTHFGLFGAPGSRWNYFRRS